MRATFASTAAVGALLATSAVAQTIPPQVLQIVASLSPQCQSTVFGLVSSPAVDCLNIPETIQVISDFTTTSPNASLILPLDQLLAVDCSSPGCSNATISSLVSNITTGCSAELRQYNISSSLVGTVAQHYPLAREVACLRTSNSSAVTNSSTSSSSNSTELSNVNGTVFCASSLLTTLSSKLSANLTIPFFLDLYKSYQNGSISRYASLFEPTDTCEECIFAAADVVGTVYPQIGNLTLRSLGFAPNSTNSTSTIGTFNSTGPRTMSIPGASPSVYNTTLSSILNSTCSAEGLAWTSNGTLPEGIVLGANNSSFGLPLYYGVGNNETFTPQTPASPIRINATSPAASGSASAAASAPAVASSRPTATASAAAGRRNVADVKARWVGQV